MIYCPLFIVQQDVTAFTTRVDSHDVDSWHVFIQVYRLLTLTNSSQFKPLAWLQSWAFLWFFSFNHSFNCIQTSVSCTCEIYVIKAQGRSDVVITFTRTQTVSDITRRHFMLTRKCKNRTGCSHVWCINLTTHQQRHCEDAVLCVFILNPTTI